MPAAPIQIRQINHVTTMVKDTARAMQFYHDLLGIRQIQSQVDNPAITWLQLENGVMVHLIETDEAPAKPGNIHHAFQVDDLAATRAALESSGYEILRGGVRYDGQAYFFIEDPDGNSVEFCTAAGYAPAPGLTAHPGANPNPSGSCHETDPDSRISRPAPERRGSSPVSSVASPVVWPMNPYRSASHIPACAEMTGTGAGMTGIDAGMTTGG